MFVSQVANFLHALACKFIHHWLVNQHCYPRIGCINIDVYMFWRVVCLLTIGLLISIVTHVDFYKHPLFHDICKRVWRFCVAVSVFQANLWVTRLTYKPVVSKLKPCACKCLQHNNFTWVREKVPLKAVITRRKCNVEDNVKGMSKLYTDFVLQTFVDNFKYDVLVKDINLLRTDTTLDLSQKAEKSWLFIWNILIWGNNLMLLFHRTLQYNPSLQYNPVRSHVLLTTGL